MRRPSPPPLLAILLALSALLLVGACSCQPDLLELPVGAAGGRISLVEAANPEGGSRPTAGGSDLSVPPREGDLGWWVDLAAGPDGTLHLAYTDAYEGELHYARQEATGWKITVVDRYGAVGKYPALAVDAEGRPHILYYNQDRRRLMYATPIGAEKSDPDDRRRPFQGAPSWFFEVVDDGDEVGMAAELRAFQDGSVQGVYYTSKENFVHVRRPPGPVGEHRHWDRKIIDDKAGGSHSIVVGFLQGPDGTLHTSYANWTVFDSQLRYATLAPGAKQWAHRTLPTPANAGWKSGLALRPSDGGVQIAYLTLRDRRIVFLDQAADGSFEATHLVGSANTLALARTGDGTLYLPYEHLPGVGLAGARMQLLSHPATATARKGWSLRSLGPRGAMASYLAVAILPDGRPTVAWYDGDVRGVKVWIGDAN